ncbi:acyltransferase, partial [Miniimonas arenae]|uniref:acyltransferase n=1 Tax=Miniimonas arenae TaxID=676201 RepID=UPI0028B071B7
MESSMPHEGDVVEYAPWHVMNGDAAPAERVANATRVAALRERGHDVAESAFVARGAVVDARRFALGERSYLAAHVHVRDDVEIGADCSLNVGTEARGLVRIGDGVRIGARSAILGFDHGFDRVDVPVREQPHTVRGIEIGDDVWLGAHVLVLDGVRIGAHAVVGAGAVVTRDVPAYAVAVGNPARVVRDRRTGQGPEAAAVRTARGHARAIGEA